MEGPTGRKSLWKNLRQRLRLKGMGICGSSWGLQASGMPPRIEDEEQEETHDFYGEDECIMGAMAEIPAAEQRFGGSARRSMNLATALAVDRRRNEEAKEETTLKSLIRLFEETDGEDVKGNDGGGELGGVCCVCMERSKGAAFIPCGHTYCRVCSREVWLNRRSCPLCNKPIVEILNIF